jgi:ureidoglycolate hydrolase
LAGLDIVDIKPHTSEIRYINGRLPYAYHIGTWHAPPFALGDWYSYLVVDRSGTLDDDWEMVDLKNALDVTIEIEL